MRMRSASQFAQRVGQGRRDFDRHENLKIAVVPLRKREPDALGHAAHNGYGLVAIIQVGEADRSLLFHKSSVVAVGWASVQE